VTVGDILKFAPRPPNGAGGTEGDVPEEVMLKMASIVDRCVNDLIRKCDMRLSTLQVKYYTDPVEGDLRYTIDFDGIRASSPDDVATGEIKKLPDRDGPDDEGEE
jgi:hypothetical protein